MLGKIKLLKNRPNLQKVIININWLFADKILRMAVGLFVLTWIARYLGPEQYGLWNYVIAFTSLFGAFAALGLDTVVVRDIVKNPSKRDILLGSAFFLKILGGIFAFFVSIAAIYFVKGSDKLTLYLAVLSALGFIFQSLDVIDFYFQSQLKSKYTVISCNSAFLLATIVKVVLLIYHAPLLAFAVTGLAEIFLSSIFLLIAYGHNHLSINKWVYSLKVAKNFLKDSWPIIFSGLAIMIYMRIDQVMIGTMLGNIQVGIYSAAVGISEMWYFIPMVIVSSVFPIIIESKKHSEELYYLRLQKLYNMMAILSIAVAIITTFLSKQIINFLYGANYSAASSVLMLHIWAGIFVCLGVASGKWLLIENLQKYGLYRTLLGAIINILLNLVLIPKYGVNGAAVATVISYGISVNSVILFKKTRISFFMMLKTFNFFNIARQHNA